MKAAVFYEHNAPLTVEEIDIDKPKRGEVLVKIAASGVCHSDLSVINGTLPFPSPPAVLGHEGAGVVQEIGADVASVSPGDHVILSWRPSCGKCSYCVTGRPQLCQTSSMQILQGYLPDGTTRLHKGEREIRHFTGVASFAEYAVVPEAGVVKIRPDVPLDAAALVGCGVMTGVGAVINTAKVPPGASVVVLGCGGVGLNVVQGAVLAGAEKIIAVDLNPQKLAWAKQFGATHVVNPADGDPVTQVLGLTDGLGAEYAFEVIGRADTIVQAYHAIRPGGMAVVVGVAKPDDMVMIPALSLLQEKTLTGSIYGSARPSVDMPKLIDLYMSKRLKLDELVTRRIKLEQINDAFAWMEKGEVARSVIVY
ncbi:MAG TPA: Zn-dependent alcohol dehydrogenase [Methylomirabilota bacterium]|nr:Zn-dependent alcohol dehydrogenase [Methylomirabilota bacterium]